MKRLLALLLILAMLVGILPTAYAADLESQPTLVVQTEDGTTALGEDWNESYPFGTFAFAAHQADVGEPGALTKDGEAIPTTVTIPVYRVGGTTGRVTVRILYTPAITTDPDGTEAVYDYAASGKRDLRIEYENPDPRAAYQPLGLPRQLLEMQPEGESVLADIPDAPQADTDILLKAPRTADSYIWQAKRADGTWMNVKDANGSTMPVAMGDLWDYENAAVGQWDYRCILVQDGQYYCTASVLGEEFEPYAAPQPMPADLPVSDEITYSSVDFDDDYDIYEFELTFAEGETEKNIRVTALDDSIPELPELGMFTIMSCEGGELSDLGNTLTVMVSDDDEQKRSTVGFAVDRILADQDNGTAYAVVRRTGGTSYNVTVDYTTEDGTAAAGQQYAMAQGTIAFAGSIDEITIPISLIAEPAREEELSFRLVLSNVTGGGEEQLCTLAEGKQSVEIVLTSGGQSFQLEKGRNLATILSDVDADDVSGGISVREDSLIGETAEESWLSVTEASASLPAVIRPEPATRKFASTATLGFQRGADYNSGGFWHDWESVVNETNSFVKDKDAANAVGYAGRFPGNAQPSKGIGTVSLMNTAGGSYLQYRTNYRMQATATIAGGGRYFDGMNFFVNWQNVGTSDFIFYHDIWCQPYFEFHLGNGQRHTWGGNLSGSESNRDYNWFSAADGTEFHSRTVDGSDITKKEGSVLVGFGGDIAIGFSSKVSNQWDESNQPSSDEPTQKDTVVNITHLNLHRRVFANPSLKLNIYTANDANEASGYSPIPSTSPLYNTLIPNVTLLGGVGGVNSNGQLYAGSAFAVSFTGRDNFGIWAGSDPSRSVYVTNSAGKRVGKVTLLSGGSYRVEMMWDGMTEADLNDTYTLNVVYRRTQMLSVDITASVPHLKDSEGNDTDTIDPAAVAEAWKNFTDKGAARVGYVTMTDSSEEDMFGEVQVQELALTTFSSGANGTAVGPAALSFLLPNIQWVNLGQDKEDVIVFNGKAYAGNANIPIADSAFSLSELRFDFYDSAFLDSARTMTTRIDHVEVYYDTNADGKITGSLQSGVFTPSNGDRYLGTVRGDISDSLYKPVVEDNGTVHQYFFKVYYSMNPKALNPPAGYRTTDKAQVLPLFLSYVTGTDGAAKLSEDVKTYRYVHGGNTDGHPMFGAKASAITYVDIPLGGDISTTVYESSATLVTDADGNETQREHSSGYTWTPAYVGNLLIPFAHPEPIQNATNPTGSPMPVAGETPVLDADGSYCYTEAGLARINAYLGGMVDRCGFGLAVQEQKKNINQIKTTGDINPESVTIGAVSTTPTDYTMLNQQSGGDPDASQGATPQDTYPEFGMDMGTELPSLDFNLGDYATVSIDGYDAGFSIGIPLFKYEKSESYASREATTIPGGTKTQTVTKVDDRTTETRTEYHYNDGSVVRSTVTQTAPDANGNTSTTTVTERINNNVTTTTTDTTTKTRQTDGTMRTETTQVNNGTTTAAPPPSASESAKNGFGEANGQMDTVKDFCRAVKSFNPAALKSFMQGNFQDETLKEAQKGNTTTRKVSVSFTVQLAFLFEYNPVDNSFYFRNAGISAALGIEVSMQYRFTPFPLAYVYVKLGVSLELSLGLTCDRTAVLGNEITAFVQGSSLANLSRGQSVTFPLDMRKDVEQRGFHISLDGKVYMEVFPDRPAEGAKPLAASLVNGTDTEEETEVILQPFEQIVYIRLTPISSRVTATSLKPILEAESKVYFDGVSIKPGLSVEAGVGIGIELLKFELFVKTSFDITMTMGGYNFDTEEYEGFYMSDLSWNLAVGFNVTAAFFSTSMDAIGLYISGSQAGTGGNFTWEISAAAGSGLKELWHKTTYTDASGKSIDDPDGEDSGDSASLIHVNGPVDVSKTQALNAVYGTPATRAIRPTGTQDFELSGYNTSGDAIKLIDGLTTGYTYKLFSAAGENYIVYPLMLDGVPQLVLSRIVTTGSSGRGLVNPVQETAAAPYILLDKDGTTDFDFDLSVSGSTVTAVWTTNEGAAAYDSVAESAAHTIVKTARLDLASDTAFAEPSVLTEADGNYRFLPVLADGKAVYLERSGSAAGVNALLRAYLKAKNPTLTDEALDTGVTTDASLATVAYRWMTQSMLNDLNGAANVLKTADGAELMLDPGEYVENLEAAEVDGATVLAYSTAKTIAFRMENGSPVSVGLDGITADTDLATLRRLYLCQLDNSGFGKAKLVQTVIDFDGCSYNNLDSSPMKDGIYSGGALVGKPQADPYFAQLKFVDADLDGSGSRTLFLYEMGGNTYLMDQRELTALAAGQAAQATVTPIFASATGTDVTIGSDGQNLAVVFTAPVADTVNNAIYIAYWDKNLNAWGTPTILAMNHLQVYEDRIADNMTAEQAERVYLGQGTTPSGHTGGADRLTFSNLQMTIQRQTVADQNEDRLLILTEGSKTGLTDTTFHFADGKDYTTKVADGTANVGFYAISFGAGEQAIGEASLRLNSYSFHANDDLIGELHLTNTGTAAIRGSDANPLLITLYADSGEEPAVIAQWQIAESMPSGGKLTLYFDRKELPETLPAGTVFYAIAAEDSSYFTQPASVRTPNLLTIEAKPDLLFNAFDVELVSVNDGRARLQLNSEICNLGSKDAENVFIQFSYDTGRTEDNGEPIYAPLDLTGSLLTTSTQIAIPTRKVDTDLPNGVYKLTGPDGSDLKAGYLRTVGGELSVPVDSFLSLPDISGLHLRAELFSDADTIGTNGGLYTAKHGEYNTLNNRTEQTVKHETRFTAPAQISTALGNTLKLPASFTSTAALSDILVTEISDGSENWKPCMGILYYDTEHQVIVAAPNAAAEAQLAKGQTPTGIIQLEDAATNSVYAIAYKVTAMGSGVNIYKDDASFTFTNADGSPTDLNAAEGAGQSWQFMDRIPNGSWFNGQSLETPMNHDLSVAKATGAKVSFATVADTITLYFNGMVVIKSDTFGTPLTITESPALIRFDNEYGATHTVSIVAAEGTQLDRYTATYKANALAPTDDESPTLLWNRSFPETASVQEGDTITMTCFVLDESGLGSISFNGVTLSQASTPKLEKVTDKFWRFTCEFTKNGTYTVRVTDTSGNITSGNVQIDWFNSVVSADAIATAPEFDETALSFTDQNGKPIGATMISYLPWLSSGYVLQAGESSEAYPFAGGFVSRLVQEGSAERWQTVGNGYYLVRINREDGSWSQTVVQLTNVDRNIPTCTAYYDALSGTLRWIAEKQSGTALITSVTINGRMVNTTQAASLTGAMPITCCGAYVMVVRDSADNETSVTIRITDVDVSAADCSLTVSGTTDQGLKDGSIMLNLTNAIGGTWVKELSDPANGIYHARYDVALFDSVGELADRISGESAWHSGTVVTFLDLAAGSYHLVVADGSDHSRYAVLDVTIEGATTHSYELTTEIQATCTEAGSRQYACTRCGQSCTESLEPLGHAWGEWRTVKEPTCGTTGQRARACSRCHEEQNETIPSLIDTCPTKDFTDVSRTAWYHVSVDFVVNKGLMDGVRPNEFAPSGTMTRAMVVTVLWRMEGKPLCGENPFEDVKEGKWFTDAIKWAAANGIVNGNTPTTFAPNREVTREQLATILYRYAGTKGLDLSGSASLEPFPDHNKVSGYARTAMSWAVFTGLISGSKSEGVDYLIPRYNATRAQVAAILMRFDALLNR